jgi:hypothetical protein
VQTGSSTVSNVKIEQRALDKYLGDLYRTDPCSVSVTFSEYKKIWKQTQKLKQMKIRYGIFEPLPNETAIDFKKRLKPVILDIPIESLHDYEERIKRAFNK